MGNEQSNMVPPVNLNTPGVKARLALLGLACEALADVAAVDAMQRLIGDASVPMHRSLGRAGLARKAEANRLCDLAMQVRVGAPMVGAIVAKADIAQAGEL